MESNLVEIIKEVVEPAGKEIASIIVTVIIGIVIRAIEKRKYKKK